MPAVDTRALRRSLRSLRADAEALAKIDANIAALLLGRQEIRRRLAVASEKIGEQRAAMLQIENDPRAGARLQTRSRQIDDWVARNFAEELVVLTSLTGVLPKFREVMLNPSPDLSGIIRELLESRVRDAALSAIVFSQGIDGAKPEIRPDDDRPPSGFHHVHMDMVWERVRKFAAAKARLDIPPAAQIFRIGQDPQAQAEMVKLGELLELSLDAGVWRDKIDRINIEILAADAAAARKWLGHIKQLVGGEK